MHIPKTSGARLPMFAITNKLRRRQAGGPCGTKNAVKRYSPSKPGAN